MSRTSSSFCTWSDGGKWKKKLGRLEERHILGTLTNPGDPHYPFHDDNDYDGNNDEEQQKVLHLVGESTISVGRGNIFEVV